MFPLLLWLGRQLVARYTPHLKLNKEHVMRFELCKLCPQTNAMQFHFSIFKDKDLIERISAAIGFM
jgi:hypothetical protein